MNVFNSNFNCERAKPNKIRKMCIGETQPCCFYCEHIKICYENWQKKPPIHTCLKRERGCWCSQVKDYINNYYVTKEKVVFT